MQSPLLHLGVNQPLKRGQRVVPTNAIDVDIVILIIDREMILRALQQFTTVIERMLIYGRLWGAKSEFTEQIVGAGLCLKISKLTAGHALPARHGVGAGLSLGRDSVGAGPPFIVLDFEPVCPPQQAAAFSVIKTDFSACER